MNRTARVTSIEAVRTFQAALRKYHETLRDCVIQLTMEINRGVDWIESDRMSYWPREVRQSSDELIEARNNLERKQIRVRAEDIRPSCYDEKKAVERAKQRLRFCEERLANTKRWLHIVRHDSEEFRSVIAKLSHFVDFELPNSIAKLDQLAAALEKYAESH